MNAYFPDTETVRAALSLANRAPSVHNSQPWRWRVGSQSIHLYVDMSQHLPHTDPDRRDLVVSCGTALNHCVVALAALGWQSKVSYLPNPADPDHLASIQPHPLQPGPVDVALAAAIPRRRTDRRHYSSWTVPPGDIAVMGSRVARMGVAMRRVDVTANFHALLASAVRQHLSDAEYLTELTQWSGRYAATAGVPARNTPESDPDDAIPARLFAGPVLAQSPDGTDHRDGATVLALGTATDGVVHRLRAGEATSMILLTATASGLSSCPITEPLEVVASRESIRKGVFDGESYPQMLLRIGWAPVNADPLPATPRRPFHELVTRLDGSPFDSGEPFE
ncbi:Acg family FMN-binding oxidoreductase [Mycobacterium sp. UM_WWY]